MCWHRRVLRMVLIVLVVLVVKINSTKVRADRVTAKADSLLCLYLMLRREELEVRVEARFGQLNVSVNSNRWRCWPRRCILKLRGSRGQVGFCGVRSKNNNIHQFRPTRLTRVPHSKLNTIWHATCHTTLWHWHIIHLPH
jgi:hypothetical protein